MILALLDFILRRFGNRVPYTARMLADGYPKLPKRVQVRHTPRLSRWIGKLGGVNAAANTIAHTILIADMAYLNPALLRHELVHVRQWERYGAIGFTWRYLRYHRQYGYGLNPMEMEAEAAE